MSFLLLTTPGDNMGKEFVCFLAALLSVSTGLRVLPNSPFLEADRLKPHRPLGDEPLHAGDDSVVVAGLPGNAGMIPVLPDGSAMFYWFFNRINGNITTDSVPLILWLEGGPGCSSMAGTFIEMGPLYVDSNLQPQRRSPTWTSEFHMLFIDNPLGAGYSTANSDADYVQNETAMATNLYNMLQQLCVMHNAWFTGREFYIFGESYAGKYVPVMGNKILLENQNKSNCQIPLAGLGIGDGWTNPPVQTTAYGDYAFAAGVIDEKEYEDVQKLQRASVEFYDKGDLVSSINSANAAVNQIVEYGGGLNMYNIREFTNYNFSLMNDYLSLNETKTTLHVPNATVFRMCGQQAFNAMAYDEMVPVIDVLPFIFSQIKVMFYNGQDDLICNLSGTELYLSILQWPGLQDYLAAERTIWTVDDQVAGYARVAGNVVQVAMLKAGHMVAIDQPGISLDMVTRFIYNKGWGY